MNWVIKYLVEPSIEMQLSFSSDQRLRWHFSFGFQSRVSLCSPAFSPSVLQPMPSDSWAHYLLFEPYWQHTVGCIHRINSNFWQVNFSIEMLDFRWKGRLENNWWGTWEDWCEFSASLGYLVNSRPPWIAKWDPVLDKCTDKEKERGKKVGKWSVK